MKQKFNSHLILGDVTQESLFSKEFIDLTVTSPPYNIDMNYHSTNDNLSYKEYLKFSKKWLSNLLSWTNKTGRLCLNIALDKNKGGIQAISSDILSIAKQVGWKYQGTIIWNEQNISRRTAWGSWLSASAPYVIAPVEVIIIFYKNEWKKSYKGKSDITKEEFIKWTNGLWTFNGENPKKVGHPAPFPEELPHRCIKLFSYQEDQIFDPFLGSGTTGVVSHKLHRKFTGVEISEEYLEVAKNRINHAIESSSVLWDIKR